MTEIRIPVSAPGSAEAAAQVRAVAAAAREAAEAEDRHIAKLKDSASRLDQLAQIERKIVQERKRSADERVKIQQHEAEASRAAMRERGQTFIRMQQAEAEQMRRFRGDGDDGGRRSNPMFQALSRAGGPLGQVAGILGSGGLEGFRVLGLGAMAAGLAFKAVAEAENRGIQAAEQLTEARQRLRLAIDANRAAAVQAGEGYFSSQGRSERRLTAANVDGGQVKSLLAAGYTNAASGLAELGKTRDAETRDRQMRAAQIVARTEGVGLDEAVKVVRDVGANGATPHADAARAINRMRGLKGRDRISAEELNREDYRLQRDGRYRSVDTAKGAAEGAARDRRGAAGTADRASASAVSAPEAAAMTATNRAWEDKLHKMEAAADAEWAYPALLRDIWLGGSKATEFYRERGKFADAVGASR